MALLTFRIVSHWKCFCFLCRNLSTLWKVCGNVRSFHRCPSVNCFLIWDHSESLSPVVPERCCTHLQIFHRLTLGSLQMPLHLPYALFFPNKKPTADFLAYFFHQLKLSFLPLSYPILYKDEGIFSFITDMLQAAICSYMTDKLRAAIFSVKPWKYLVVWKFLGVSLESLFVKKGPSCFVAKPHKKCLAPRV